MQYLNKRVKYFIYRHFRVKFVQKTVERPKLYISFYNYRYIPSYVHGEHLHLSSSSYFQQCVLFCKYGLAGWRKKPIVFVCVCGVIIDWLHFYQYGQIDALWLLYVLSSVDPFIFCLVMLEIDRAKYWYYKSVSQLDWLESVSSGLQDWDQRLILLWAILNLAGTAELAGA